MDYVNLGNSDLEVSRICLGCMGFGDAGNGQHSWTIDEPSSREIIKLALEQGINFFDTAIGYQNGTSEEYLGRAIKDFAKREDVVIATKFLPRTQEEIANGVTGQEHIKNSLEISLKHLNMDYVDLYIYHIWDYNTPIYDVMEGLNAMVQAGKVRHIGVANCFAWQLADANAIARANGWAEFVSVQNHYNMLFREEEREMAPLCIEKNIAMTPYSALASGRLSRLGGEVTKRMTEDAYAKFKYDKTADQDQLIVERVAEIAKKYNTSMTAVSLSWLMTKVEAPIVGATKPHHLTGMMDGVKLKLTDEDTAYLEELYIPHALVGVMAQNKPATNDIKQVWTR